MLRLAIALVILALLSSEGSPASANSGNGAGRPRVVSVLGVAQVQGRDAFVDVLVVVPPGADVNATAARALAEQGARPVDPRTLRSSAFSTTGLVWPQFSDSITTNNFVTQYYNPSRQPTSAAEIALTNTHSTWSSVSASSFRFSYGGGTTRCPSLVRECPGPQFNDGFNDVGWLVLAGCCTLGVTWFTTSSPEADMALNINFSWFTDGRDFDIETVFLHENGHVAGLGHSDDPNAVMYPYYQGVRHSLGQDDVNGISFLYPATTTTTTGTVTGTVTSAATGAEIAGATVSTDTAQSTTTSSTGTYTLTGVPTGNRTVTASATGYVSASQVVSVTSGGTTMANFALTPTPADFSIKASPSSRTVPAGSSTSYTITLTSLNGYGFPVNLSVTGLPAGATATFSSSSVIPTSSGATSTLTVFTSGSSTPVGTSTLTITGTGTDPAATTHNTSVRLKVS